ncbi:MAG: hypothetical protein HND53_11505 [Proteobacteria bacterium]|nr:hypothetical protein [Pseudomonadota bacterium]NOG61118.1 hypothetical protein [Pseudomonadota bacterium]
MHIRLINSVHIIFILLFSYPVSLKADHGSSMNLSIGGRIKFDTIYNFDSVGGARTSKADLAFSPDSIPVSNNGNNNLNANLRESRLWATLNLPLNEQNFSTYIEFDFFNSRRDSSGRSHVGNDPRLRHLYLSYNSITIGKTYSTLTNISAYPEINDANGPLGVTTIRQELIRFRKGFSWGDIFLAIEKPESTFTSVSGSSFQVNDEQVPDLIGKINFRQSWGNWSLAGIVREIYSDGKITNGQNNKLWGGAISTAGRILLPKQDNLRFTISYGNALARYISFNAFDDATIDNTGNINLTEIISGYLAYQHWWTHTFRSSFVISSAYANQDTGKAPVTVDKLFASTHVNFMWSPNFNTTVGLEWIHAYRELENGNNGYLNRLQLSAIYKF